MNSASRERLAGDLPMSAALQLEPWWDEEGTATQQSLGSSWERTPFSGAAGSGLSSANPWKVHCWFVCPDWQILEWACSLQAHKGWRVEVVWERPGQMDGSWPQISCRQQLKLQCAGPASPWSTPRLLISQCLLLSCPSSALWHCSTWPPL